MRFVRQRSKDDNVVAVLKNLVLILDVKISMSTVEQVAVHPSYPSLSAVSDALFEWNIDNVPARLDVLELQSASLPILVHFSIKNEASMAVVVSVDEKTVHYIDPAVGIVSDSISDFEKKWSGISILIESKNFTEERFYEKRRAELFASGLRVTAAVLATALVFLPIFITTSEFFIEYILKFFGVCVSLLLVKKQFDPLNAPLQLLCKANSPLDCNAVIKSSASNVFGLVYLSEIALLYYLGGFLTLLLSHVSNVSYPFLLFILTIVTTPVALVSLFYQWRILRRWCLLCVTLAGIILLEGVLTLFNQHYAEFSWKNSSLLLIGFSLPVIGWHLIRKYLIDWPKISTLDRSLAKFRMSERVFKLLLDDASEVQRTASTCRLYTGRFDAPLTITFVSSLMCNPCRIAKEKVDSLIAACGDNIKVDFRFYFDPADGDTEINRAIRHIVAIGLSKSGDAAWDAFTSWYSDDHANVDQWALRFPVDNSLLLSSQIEAVLNEQREWFRESGLPGTPIILINNKLYPSEFSLSDLKFHVRKQLELIPDKIFHT